MRARGGYKRGKCRRRGAVNNFLTVVEKNGKGETFCEKRTRHRREIFGAAIAKFGPDRTTAFRPLLQLNIVGKLSPLTAATFH